MTRREIQVAEGFARRLSYKKVAAELNIAPATVRNHLASIYDKLGISTKTELVRLLWSGGQPAPEPRLPSRRSSRTR